MEETTKLTAKIAGIIKGGFFVLLFFLFSLSYFLYPAFVHAATLTISPSSGSYQNGKTFSATIFVASADEAMNAASGVISYPADKLEVLSVSKSGSIFSLWAQEPSFGGGRVSFEGIVLNPGYKGSSGKIITINFKAKSIGEAVVSFSSGSVLANDGQGTNILSGFGSAKYNINVPAVGPQADESSTLSERAGAPLAPRVTSSGCSDSQGWCAGNDPVFTWNLPAGTTGVSLLADQYSGSNPGSRSDGLMSSQTYKNVDDGIWYFHVKLRNSYGWGAVTHYKFQIDSGRPESFNLSLAEEIDSQNPRAKLVFDAKDSLSGIYKYEIKIDNGSPKFWIDEGGHIYQTEVLSPGRHTVVAKAIDRAGNHLTSSLELAVETINSPVFTDFPETLIVGETLTIKGKTYANASVSFWIQKEGEEAKLKNVTADENGIFKLAFEGDLEEGVYSIWAQVVSSGGGASGVGQKETIILRARAIIKIGSLIVSYLTVLISLVAVAAMLLLAVLYTWHKLNTFKNKIKQEVQIVEKNIHSEFDVLRENTRKQINLLEKAKSKRELTKEEIRVLSNLKNQLNYTEELITKEVAQIEKELK